METGLQFLMQKTKNKIIKVSIYQFESFFHIDSETLSISLSYSDQNLNATFSDIFKNNLFKIINLIYFRSSPSIVPTKYFDNDLKHKYIETNSKIGNEILKDTSNDKKLSIVYSSNETLEKLINDLKIKTLRCNHFTNLYNYLSNSLINTSGLSFIINLNNNSFDIMIFNNKDFIFFNSFKISDENEFLYYLLFVLKNYESSKRIEKILFLGRFAEFEAYYDLASKYTLIEFIDENKHSLLIYESNFYTILNENYIRV